MEVWVYTVGYTIQADDADPLINTVTVTGVDEDGDEVVGSDEHSLGIEFKPVLQVVKSVQGDIETAEVGDEVTYEIEVSHAATSDGSAVSGLVVSDNVAVGAVLQSGDTLSLIHI